MPWLRMFPSIEDCNIVFATLVQLAESLQFNTQPIRHYIPDKGTIASETEADAEPTKAEKPAKRFHEGTNRILPFPSGKGLILGFCRGGRGED